MKTSGVNLRLTALGLAVGLIGVLIVLVTLNTERQAKEGRERLNQVDSESFRIAEQFKDQLREVNDKVRRFASFHEPAVWEGFLQASSQLGLWIQEQRPKLITGREKELLTLMGEAYAGYLQRAQDLHSLMEASGKSGASLADYSAFFEQSRRLLDLGQQLARAHYNSRNQLLNEASRTLAQLRLSVLGLVGCLFVFGVALALGVYRDLIAPLRVKLVESEALVQRTEKLASLGVLAAGVAHEIRNPLTAIKTALFLHRKNFKPGSRELDDAKLIEREIQRLERIVNEFLQFARPGTPELTIVPADQPIQEVEALLSPQLAKHNIRVLREGSPPLQIKVDPAQIKQVLINLVQNAAESIGERGTISLRARADRVRLRDAESDVVVLEVSDDGKGIPPEVEKRLFDPFFTTKEKGTGLGLSIAARIVELHGGTLQYQTQVNHGSTFGVVLPRAA